MKRLYISALAGFLAFGVVAQVSMSSLARMPWTVLSCDSTNPDSCATSSSGDVLSTTGETNTITQSGTAGYTLTWYFTGQRGSNDVYAFHYTSRSANSNAPIHSMSKLVQFSDVRTVVHQDGTRIILMQARQEVHLQTNSSR